jgi:hypothetical protein
MSDSEFMRAVCAKEKFNLHPNGMFDPKEGAVVEVVLEANF